MDMTKILIAEDERDIRELVNYSLQFGGFHAVGDLYHREAAELQAIVD